MKLSICIPTRNRARYLRSLLERLSGEISDLPFDCEILVGDNASSDETPEVIASMADKLPLRGFRRDEDLGAANLAALFRAARGEYLLYLADDDILLMPGLVSAIAALDRSPRSVALYAPWALIDLYRGTNRGQFYSQTTDVVIPRRGYASLLAHVLNHFVFSEISILRRDLLPKLDFLRSGIAFWAFTVPCHLLENGDLIYAAEPFYGSVTCHDADDDRVQFGNLEAENGWDTYRGGLEYMHGLALQHGGLVSRETVAKAIDRLIVSRMQVALRLRVAAGRNPIESYVLAARLRGLGADTGFSLTFDQLRIAAAIYHLAVELPSSTGATRIALLGEVNDSLFKTIQEKATVEVTVLSDPDGVLADDIVLQLGSDPDGKLQFPMERARLALLEADLMQRFP